MTSAQPGESAVQNAWIGVLMLLIGGACIGYAPIGLRLSEFGPQATAFWRYALAVPMILAIILVADRRLPRWPGWPVIVAGLCFTLDMGLWHEGLKLTSVANATFIVNLGAIGSALVAYVVLKERLTPVWAVAASVALAGAACLSFGASGEGGTGNWRGDALALAAAVLVSGYLVFSRMARRRTDFLSVIFWLTLISTLGASVLVVMRGEPFFRPDIADWGVPLSLAIVAQVAGQGLIVLGLGRTPAAIAGVLVLVQPVMAALLSFLVFRETLSSVQLLGTGLILAGIVLSQRKGRVRRLS